MVQPIAHENTAEKLDGGEAKVSFVEVTLELGQADGPHRQMAPKAPRPLTSSGCLHRPNPLSFGFPQSFIRAAALACSACRGTGPLTLWRSTIRSLAALLALFGLSLAPASTGHFSAW